METKDSDMVLSVVNQPTDKGSVHVYSLSE